jgi:hypothetical protein
MGNISLHAVHVPCPPTKNERFGRENGDYHTILLSKHRSKFRAVNKNSISHLEDTDRPKRNTVE